MWCVTIRAETRQALKHEFEEALCFAKTIECRLDGFCEIPFDMLEGFVQQASVIFSLGPKKVDPRVYYRLASLRPYALDIAHTVDHEVFTAIRKEFSKILLIASYHNFEETPENLEEVFDALYDIPADCFKCVTMAHSSLDGLKMLIALQKYAKKRPTTAFCMGQEAVFTRQLAPIFGSFLSYHCLPNKPTASGQQAIDERIAVTNKTSIYALIGNPLAHSLSHITHNAVFQKNNLDCIYVKIPLQVSEFRAAMRYFEKLGIKGLSVTMPLKGEMGGNTCRFDKETHAVCNTDGKGMLDALEQKVRVQNKRMLILGASFTGQAIAQEAIQRGALVHIANRTQEKAAVAAAKLGCKMAPWDKTTIQNGAYDILVNATSVGMNKDDTLFFEKEDLPGHIVVADVIWPKETKLLRTAKEKNCICVYGYEMWLFQAAYQFAFWTNISKQKAFDDLKEAFFDQLQGSSINCSVVTV